MKPGAPLCAVLVVTATAACSVFSSSPEPATPPAPTATPAATTPAATAPPHIDAPPLSDDWHCGGELVPPTGWQQETAFADATGANARESAAVAAADKLEKRLCGDDADTCPPLRARVSTWKTGSNGRDICAMAVVKAADLEEWRRIVGSLQKLDADVVKAADALLAGTRKSTKVTIDRLTDRGIPGGARAEWFRARLEKALVNRVTVIELPKGWAGDGLPTGADLIIRGALIPRLESQVPVVEVHLRALASAGRATKVVADGEVTFPEKAAPSPGDATGTPPEETHGLNLHIDTHQGGSLCAGEKTQVWLKSDENAVVRVFNLYGQSEALLIWPNEDALTGQVKAGEAVPLGGREGFVAVQGPSGDAEKFIAIAASSAAGLGRFADLKGTCRIPAAIAKELHASRGLPAWSKVAYDGYRLVSGGGCATATVDSAQKKAAEEALRGLPECGVK